MDLSKMTSILSEDIVATLNQLGLVQFVNGNHVICASPQILDNLIQKYPTKGLLVDPSCLHWTPLYVSDYKKDKW